MLPFRSGRSAETGASSAICLLAVVCAATALAQPKATPADKVAKATGGIAPANIPLPIGHEAKGLVLPDYDIQGRLQAKFEAATAKRIDTERIQFTGLKMTTYTVETNTADLAIDMPSSTLDLSTRVITSEERTTVARADFNISGDTMRFDTVAREGRLVGNVKMVISGNSQLTEKLGE
jgi:hypothetical protein